MALKLDAALLTGTVAVNGFDGVLTVATAFNAGGKTLEAGVKPNRYDALKFAATQIKKANFKPNYVILNSDDVLAMELERDNDGDYLFPPYLNVQPQFAGIRIVENNDMASGSYLIGDFSKAKFWMRKGMDLKIHDQNENDAITQLKTITLYMRGTLVVKDADKLAFVTDTFADSIAEITAL
jgi:HK97 family phage major capsid protein